MKAVLQRGKGVLSAPAGSTLFHFGQPPTSFAGDGPCYSICWDDMEPSASLTHQDRREIVPLTFIHPGLYSFSHPDFGLVYLLKRAWFENSLAVLPHDGLFLSYQGWYEGLWHDGCYGRLLNGSFTDLVLPGESFRATLSDETKALFSVDEWLEGERFYSQKQSLVVAVGQAWAGQGSALLSVGAASYESVLSLLLFRLAFPNNVFSLVPLDEGWKRLAQNLGLVPLRPGSSPQSSPLFSVTVPHDWGNAKAVHALLEWQMNQSPFIPAKLWRSLAPHTV